MKKRMMKALLEYLKDSKRSDRELANTHACIFLNIPRRTRRNIEED